MTKTPGSKTQDKYGLHKEIIIGSFVIGTLAFVVAHAWNSFFGQIVKQQTKKHQEIRNGEKTDNDESRGIIFYYGMYALIITVFAVLVVFMIIQLDFLRHKTPGRFATFRPSIH